MATGTWIVLPTYDEAESLAPLLARLREELTAAGERWRILVVDDSSPDGTGILADRLASEDDRIEVLHRPRRTGIAAAYADGFDRALESGAELVVQMDADASHDPADVARLLAAVRAGADVVIGSRYVAGGGIEGWSRLRRALSRFGSWYARRILGLGTRDLTSGFKCFTRAALAVIAYRDARARGYAFLVEMTHSAAACGLEIVEIPIVFRERRHGRSKMSVPIALEAAWAVPALRRRARPEPAATEASGGSLPLR